MKSILLIHNITFYTIILNKTIINIIEFLNKRFSNSRMRGNYTIKDLFSLSGNYLNYYFFTFSFILLLKFLSNRSLDIGSAFISI